MHAWPKTHALLGRGLLFEKSFVQGSKGCTFHVHHSAREALANLRPRAKPSDTSLVLSVPSSPCPHHQLAEQTRQLCSSEHLATYARQFPVWISCMILRSYGGFSRPTLELQSHKARVTSSRSSLARLRPQAQQQQQRSSGSSSTVTERSDYRQNRDNYQTAPRPSEWRQEYAAPPADPPGPPGGKLPGAVNNEISLAPLLACKSPWQLQCMAVKFVPDCCTL